ncbi:hypothetical protein [Enterococcus wangshanyuanii]|uniref:XRE family transcriptional regulator n=1 Tax=Enterococcus wangshanyuanii TaxID=2005703 RepID=A0ABQ1PS99_9ENTE|nr:hypothetical protein [Enterococcus wangshanyuanii]GGD02211.1 hypothetical protein GCM10011573_34630 [Enterococcus wangshanyuanii]
MQNIADIKQVFWTNVDWHRQNKGLTWMQVVGGNVPAARNKTRNVTLEKIQEIAEILGIEDYAILFEEIVKETDE